MSMNKINGSDLVRQNMLEKFQGTTRSEKDKAEGSAQEESTAAARPTIPGDKAEISETAQKLMELRQAIHAGRSALVNEPDIREDKVAEVKQRLDQGFYNSVEVRDEVAEKLRQVFEGMPED